VIGHTYAPGLDESGFVEVCQTCGQPEVNCTEPAQFSHGDGNRPRPSDNDGSAAEPAQSGRQVVVTLASSIRPRPVRWLWPERIPSGALTLLAGREGIGKSLVGVHLAAQLTRGTLPGDRHGQPSRVLFATSEDAWEFTMVPRLLAAGADLDRIGRVQVADEGVITGLTLPADAHELGGYMESHQVALLVLDPLTSVMDGRIDAHRDREVRSALEPLGQLAERARAAVLGLVHLGKGMGSDPVNLILGSRAFSAVARVAMVAARDPDDDDESRSVLSVEMSNLGRIDVPGLTYRIDGTQIMTDEGPAGAGLLVWTGETDRRVRNIMADAEDRGEKTRADDYLRKALVAGPRPTKAVEEEAREVHRISKRTLERARGDLKIPTAKVGDAWWISLPEHEGDLRQLNSAKDAKSASPGVPGGVGGVAQTEGT
jgi:AAA domain